MTRPIPDLNPVSTGSEMKLATNPRRTAAATMSIPPTSNARVAAAGISSPGDPFGAASLNDAPVRIAIVVVVLTLSGREVPSTAYTATGTSAVYRPTWTGSAAMVA